MDGTTRRGFLVQTAGALTAVAIMPDLSAAAWRASGPLSVGLIGAGRQGRAILGELQKLEGVQVVGVCDVDASRRDSGARRVQGAVAYADHREMLDKAKGMQAVIIATPTHLHKDAAVNSLRAGKHVYCEAPMAHTVEDCREIAQAAAASKSVFQVGLEARSNPVYKLARTFYRSDAVRDPVSAEAQHCQKTSWRFPAPDARREREANWRLDPEVSLGLPGELGVHQFDVAMWYMDSVPTAVRGWGAVKAYEDGRTVADTVQCELIFARGVRMQYLATLANSFGGRFEVLRGTNAAVKLAWSHGWMFKEADAPTQGWEVYANRQQFHNDEGITLIADATKLASQGKLKEGIGLPNPSLYYALSDFVKSASENKPSVCDGAAGLRTTAVAIAAAKAVATGGEVAIDPESLKVGSA